jgi:deoxyxylulose-5-phosphate synthase
MVKDSLEAADALATDGIDAEVIDLATLKPYDEPTVLASVGKTGRCVIVHEAARTAGFGAEIAALIAERGRWRCPESPTQAVNAAALSSATERSILLSALLRRAPAGPARGLNGCAAFNAADGVRHCAKGARPISPIHEAASSA